MDELTLKHLNAWLERQESLEQVRNGVRELMLKEYTNDPEFYYTHDWIRLYDTVVTNEIRDRLTAEAQLQLDLNAMAGETMD